MWALILNAVPVFTFSIGGLIRYRELKGIGKFNVNFSRFFIVKLLTYVLLIVVESTSFTLKLI